MPEAAPRGADDPLPARLPQAAPPGRDASAPDSGLPGSWEFSVLRSARGPGRAGDSARRRLAGEARGARGCGYETRSRSATSRRPALTDAAGAGPLPAHGEARPECEPSGGPSSRGSHSPPAAAAVRSVNIPASPRRGRGGRRPLPALRAAGSRGCRAARRGLQKGSEATYRKLLQKFATSGAKEGKRNGWLRSKKKHRSEPEGPFLN
nr:EZH inhibitory protein-like [Dasypus novemcinctus]